MLIISIIGILTFITVAWTEERNIFYFVKYFLTFEIFSELPQLVSLTLHTNNLTSLAEEVISDLPRLQSLRLEHNKLACNCKLSWILNHETLAPLAR